MKNYIRKTQSLFFVLCVFSIGQSVFADSQLGHIKKLLKSEYRIQKDLKRSLSKARPNVLSAIAKGRENVALDDSDNDGLSDSVENAVNLNSCNSDSDNDGNDDGDAFENVETAGAISAISAGSLTITKPSLSVVTYLIDSATRFDSALTAYVVGAHVEVNGEFRTQPDHSVLLFAKKVKIDEKDGDNNNDDQQD